MAAAPSSTYDVIVNDIYASENARHGGPTWSYRQKEFAAQVHRVRTQSGAIKFGKAILPSILLSAGMES